MKPIKVIVHGALGKMGKEVVSAVSKNADMELVGAVDIKAKSDSIILESSIKVPLDIDLEKLILKCHPEVMVDFSLAEASMSAARIAAKNRINLVTGTTGLSEQNFQELKKLAEANNIGIVMAANFALGMVVMIHLAKVAARYFDTAEIIELHHEEKVDSPSGTALATAQAMVKSHGKPFISAPAKKEIVSGCRGGLLDGIAIHSVRLPGFVASQEIIMGLQGQTLRLQHNAINRECYMPGVILAIKEVVNNRGSIRSLEDLLNLGGT